MNKYILILLLFLIPTILVAGKRYWVGGTETWNTTAGTKWSTSSGGSGGASVPTSADTVYLDANSGTVTVTTSSSICKSIFMTGFTGTLAMSSQITIYGDVIVSSSATYTGGNSFVWSVGGTSASYYVTSNGKSVTFGLYFAATSSSAILKFVDSFTSTGGIQHSGGTIDFQNNNISVGFYNGIGSNSKVLTIGSGNLTLTSISYTGMSQYVFNVISNTTVTSYTGTIYITGYPSFSGNGLTYNRVEFISTGKVSAYVSIKGTNTFGDLIVNITGSSYLSLIVLDDQTITDTLKIVGESRTKRLFLRGKKSSNVLFTAGTHVYQYIDLQNINTDDAVDLSLKDCGNVGDNGVNITFATPVTRYAVMSGNYSWSNTSMWSTTSGGSTGASVPIPGDIAIFDASTTGGSRTLTLDMITYPEIDLTNVNGGSWVITISYGVITKNLKMANKVSGISTVMHVASVYDTITISGANPTSTNMYVDTYNGRLILENITSTSIVLNHWCGNVELQSNISLASYTSSSPDAGSLNFKFNSYTLTLSSNTGQFAGTYLSRIYYGTGTLKFTGNPTSNRNVNLSSTADTLYNLEFSPTGTPTSNYYINGNTNIYILNELKLGPKARVGFKSSYTTYVNTFTAAGASGSTIYITTTSAGTATLSKPSGTVTCDYCNILRSVATGGATWNATNSTDAGSNTGWNFITAGSTITPYMMFQY